MRLLHSALRAPSLPSALGQARTSLSYVHEGLTSVLLAAGAPGEASTYSSPDVYVYVYVSLVVALFSGIGWLFYRDNQTGQRKREAIASRTTMAETLRTQGREREAKMLDTEREQLEDQIEDAKFKPAWEQDKSAKLSRQDKLDLAAAMQVNNSKNRIERREEAKAKVRQEKAEAKVAAKPKKPDPPPAA
ncbi:hypothetical protein T492DRAFT_1057947 [Pavlovales sp. CCMP2436]|nr:hypothetical protein T492DRAFT_1057947 [Pavlovales sp. CCMP2436]